MKFKILLTSILAAGFLVSANAQLAKGGAKFLGNITTNSAVRSDMGTYWNQITAENECKWGQIYNNWSGTWKYDFSGCDKAYVWAHKNNYHFKFHALIWGSQYPGILSGKSAEDTKKLIIEWFGKVRDHYAEGQQITADGVTVTADGIEMIDVVNEAMWTGSSYHSGYTDTKIIEALGGDVVNGKHTYKFVSEAFKLAREYFPKSILIYNDYNTIRWDIDYGIDLVKKIIADGAPVDAYGQQSHDISGMSKSDFENALTKIHTQTGLPIYITEYDVGSDNDEYQKTNYSNHIPFLWTTEWIAGITLWGYITGATWIDVDAKKASECSSSDWSYCNKCNNPDNAKVCCNGCSGLITNGNDRAAMTWLKEYFKTNLSKGKNTTDFSYLQTGSSASKPNTSSSSVKQTSSSSSANPSSSASVQPIAQGPYGGESAVFPGRLEMENYDVGGEGVAYYHPSPSTDNITKTYRDDDVGIAGGSIAYTAPDEWLEYTVNAAAGEYDVVVKAATGSASIKLTIYSNDTKLLEKTVDVSEDDQGWNSYIEHSLGKVTLPAGEQIIKVVIGSYVNLDYMDFKNVELVAPDPIVVSSASVEVNSSASVTAIPGADVHMFSNTLENYDIFDMQGNYMGRMSAYGLTQVIGNMQSSASVRQGVYYVRCKRTGLKQTVRITK